MKFTYSSGATPLSGYTIKRGIGQGGFGEVYYALSDGGKEVALKLVRNNLDVELRGMAQCLNLKHPNLVALYDIKNDGDGNSWVIMEYVAGESLSDVLGRHPQGLPRELIKPWFLGLAHAIGYLHDNGLVHRDLKPGNIFIENGVVKVGDYGLSKFITASQRSAQTQSVGTVHYMAPEVSTGKYGKPIDIYAAGIILYEMLTGEVPFTGESAGEILMKHLTATPDLSKLPPEYVQIVGTALAKDPDRRYASFADMARMVEAIGGPATASRPVWQKELDAKIPNPGVFTPGSAGTPGANPPGSPRVEPPTMVYVEPPSRRERIGAFTGSLALAIPAAGVGAMLYTMAVANGMFQPFVHSADMPMVHFISALFLLLLNCWAVLIPARMWDFSQGDALLRRGILLLIGLGVGTAAYWLQGGNFTQASEATIAAATSASELNAIFQKQNDFPVEWFRHLTYYGAVFFLIRWWKMAERNRPKRFSIFSVAITLVVSWFLGLAVWQNNVNVVNVATLVLAAVAVQVVSPWTPPLPKATKKVRLKYA